MSNTLACATQFFYAYFVHVLRCPKQVFHAKIYPEKVLKLSYFWKKYKNLLRFFFWDSCHESQILTPHL